MNEFALWHSREIFLPKLKSFFEIALQSRKGARAGSETAHRLASPFSDPNLQSQKLLCVFAWR
jgi:hypothetical protein